MGRYGIGGQFIGGFFNLPIFFILEDLFFELIVAQWFDLAADADKFMAVDALFIGEDVVVVEVKIFADGALKGRDVIFVGVFVIFLAGGDR